MILREKKELTKMLILIEIWHKKKKIKNIADTIGITIQGVSDYIKQLKYDKYIDQNLDITKEGLLFVTEKIEELRDYVSSLLEEVKIINVTEAIAGEPIKKGDKVGLFMEQGYIHAYLKTSNSYGIALNDALKEEDLGVASLGGILNFKMGKITVLVFPNIQDGGTRVIDFAALKTKLKGNFQKIGVYGIVPYIALKKLNISINFEYDTVRCAIAAAHRGLNSIICVSQDLLKYVIEDLEHVPKGFSKVSYHIENLSTYHN